MKRLASLVVLFALVLTGCSLGQPKPATNVTDVSATLNAVVTSNEQPGEVIYWFEYGTTTEYGTVTPDRTLQVPAGAEDDVEYPVSEPINGLEPNTTYHYKVCTSPGIEPGSRGCVEQDQSFTTGADGRSGIAFTSDRGGSYDIWTMDGDGTGQVRVTTNPAIDLDPAWSPDGAKIAFRSNRDAGDFEIYVMDADGSDQTRLTNNLGAEQDSPAWSPDGSKLVFSSPRDYGGGRFDFELAVMDANGANKTWLTTASGLDTQPAWSPDGSKIAFASQRDGGNLKLYVMDADGGNQDSLNIGLTQQAHPEWSPDGRRIAFSQGSRTYTVDADGSNLLEIATGAADPAWSPDGTRIAFESRRDGNDEIYSMDPDGSDDIRLTNSPGQDIRADWSPRF